MGQHLAHVATIEQRTTEHKQKQVVTVFLQEDSTVDNRRLRIAQIWYFNRMDDINLRNASDVGSRRRMLTIFRVEGLKCQTSVMLDEVEQAIFSEPTPPIDIRIIQSETVLLKPHLEESWNTVAKL